MRAARRVGEDESSLLDCSRKEGVAAMGKRSNGEGTIYKRKDGRWCAACYDENYRRHYVYGKTQAEVKKKLKLKQNETPESLQYLSMQEWVLEFLENYKKKLSRAWKYFQRQILLCSLFSSII